MVETRTTQTLDRVAGVQTLSLGQLLHAHRTTAQVTLEDVVRGTRFDVEVVRAVEEGRHSLALEDLADLLDGYDPSVSARLLTGSTLEVNLADAWVSLSWATEPSSFEDRPADRVLARYLSLLYAHRTLPMGTTISIRAVDLSLLRESLALRPAAVSARMEQMDLGTTDTDDGNAALVFLGLLCATGALVFGVGVGNVGTGEAVESSPPEAIATVEVHTEIGTAVSITRTPEEVRESGVAGDVQVEIGTAAVEER